MRFTIKKARIKEWGYEITAKNFHNIAPTAEAAVRYLQGRYGHDVEYRIIGAAGMGACSSASSGV